MRLMMLAMPLLAAGCVAPMVAPEPQDARLSDTVLTVALTDGTRCTADWRATGGQGQFADCAAPLSYQVTEVENPNILRKLWVELVGALGADGVAPPMADVTLTAASGRTWRYVSPPSAD